VNKKASREWHEQSRTKGMLDKSAHWVGSTVGGVVARVMPRTSAHERGSGRTSSAPRRGRFRGSTSRARSRR